MNTINPDLISKDLSCAPSDFTLRIALNFYKKEEF